MTLFGEGKASLEERSDFSHVFSRLYHLQAEQTMTTQQGRRGNVTFSFLMMGGVEGYPGAWGVGREGDAEEGTSSDAVEQT